MAIFLCVPLAELKSKGGHKAGKNCYAVFICAGEILTASAHKYNVLRGFIQSLFRSEIYFYS